MRFVFPAAPCFNLCENGAPISVPLFAYMLREYEEIQWSKKSLM